MKNLTRLLRPRGLLYISDYCLQEDERNRERYENFADEFSVRGIFRLPEGVILRHHSSEWIEALTSEFRVIHLSQITVTTMNESLAKGFQYIGEKSEPCPAQSSATKGALLYCVPRRARARELARNHLCQGTADLDRFSDFNRTPPEISEFQFDQLPGSK